MPRRPARSVPLVIVSEGGVHGLDLWWSWLALQLQPGGREVRRLCVPTWPDTALDEWLGELGETVGDLPDTGFDLVAHSIGSLLWLHHAAAPAGLPRPARVALTALPDGEHIDQPAFRDVPLDAGAVRRAAEGTILVGSDDDPTCPGGAAVVYGTPLKMATTVVPDGGHFDRASGFGPWPAMLNWCGRDNLAFY